jgi:hypothetical protein
MVDRLRIVVIDIPAPKNKERKSGRGKNGPKTFRNQTR